MEVKNKEHKKAEMPMPWWIVVSNSLITHTNVRKTGSREGQWSPWRPFLLPSMLFSFFPGAASNCSCVACSGAWISVPNMCYSQNERSSWWLFCILVWDFHIQFKIPAMRPGAKARFGEGVEGKEVPYVAALETPFPNSKIKQLYLNIVYCLPV